MPTPPGWVKCAIYLIWSPPEGWESVTPKPKCKISCFPLCELHHFTEDCRFLHTFNLFSLRRPSYGWTSYSRYHSRLLPYTFHPFLLRWPSSGYFIQLSISCFDRQSEPRWGTRPCFPAFNWFGGASKPFVDMFSSTHLMTVIFLLL